MFRCLFAGVVAVALSAGAAPAAEVKGKVKSVDAEKFSLVVTVGEKDQTVLVAKDAEVFSLGKAKKGQPAPKQPVTGGLGALTAGSEVTVTTETKDGKDVATAVRLDTAAKKKKKDK
ncbi:MAG: hypothetical protein C0501_20095 [Isosphaera sp.]|nr:hypothetical protein [Isosphaera sp.]